MTKYDPRKAEQYRGRPHSHYRNQGKHKCRLCGKKTDNHWNCPACLDRMAKGEIESPVTDVLGYDLDVPL